MRSTAASRKYEHARVTMLPNTCNDGTTVNHPVAVTLPWNASVLETYRSHSLRRNALAFSASYKISMAIMRYAGDM